MRPFLSVILPPLGLLAWAFVPSSCLAADSCATVFELAPALGTLRNEYSVEVAVGNHSTSFQRTNRGIEGLISEGGPIVEKALKSPELRGKNVLDAGTGDGQLTFQLRQSEVNAIGLDIALKPSQKTFPFFVERDIRDTGFPDGFFELSFSAFSVFYYPHLEELSPHFREEALLELSRVTRPGGHILIVALTGTRGIPESSIRMITYNGRDETARLLAGRPELELVAIEDRAEGSTVLLKKK